MAWQKALDWLLEADPDNPGVRLFTLVELIDKEDEDPDVIEAKQAVMNTGPIPIILENQADEGYWVEPVACGRGDYKNSH